MGIFSRPKGTIVTPFPEWDSGAMAWGGCNTADVPTVGSNVALYNDATDGSSLFVYILSLTSTSFAFLNIFFLPGVGANLIGPCFPIDPVLSNPFGQIYADNVALAPPLSSFGVARQNSSMPLGMNFPIAIVRPGFRLCVQSDTGADELAVGYLYRVGRS